jgi:hypothetical protein
MIRYLQTALATSALCVAALAASPAEAAHAHAGSLDIYMSVIAAPILGPHLARHPHPGIRRQAGPDAAFLVVALFDHRTGQPIEIAHVTARLRHGLRRRQTIDLEPVRLDHRVVFGNYAAFASPGRYDITVLVERPGARGGDSARFPYLQP